MSDEDVPPAGTPCSHCKAGGHFCQAKKYAGKTDVGLCEPCANGENCPRFKAVKIATQGYEEFEGVFSVPELPAVRVVPVEQWKDADRVKQSTTDAQDFRNLHPHRGRARISDEIREQIIAEPLHISNMQLERKYKISVMTIGKIRRAAGRITEGMKGGVVKAEKAEGPRVVKPGMPREQYRISDETRKAIAAEPIEVCDFDIGQKYGCSASSVHNIRIAAGLDVPVRPRGPAKGTGAGYKRGPYKTTQRAQAAELLVAGKSIRDTAEAVGLSPNIVVEVKRETPNAPAKANNGGMPQHKEKPMPTPPATTRHEQTLTLLRTETVTEGEDTVYPHPLIEGLIKSLPTVGEEWDIKQREKWMTAAISILDLIYVDPEGGRYMLSVSRDDLGE